MKCAEDERKQQTLCPWCPGVSAPFLCHHQTTHYSRKTNTYLGKQMLVRFSIICTKHIFKHYGPFQKGLTDTQEESLIVLTERCFNICFIVQINNIDTGLHVPVFTWSDYQGNKWQVEHFLLWDCNVQIQMLDDEKRNTANPHYIFLFTATHIYKYIEFIYKGRKWLPQSRAVNYLSKPRDYLLIHIGIIWFIFPA